MEEQRASGNDRRSEAEGGRRQTDPAPRAAGNPRFSARVLWHLPDNTRCWVMEHKGRQMVRVSREAQDLRIEVFDSQAEAAAQADAWCLEYGVGQLS